MTASDDLADDASRPFFTDESDTPDTPRYRIRMPRDFPLFGALFPVLFAHALLDPVDPDEDCEMGSADDTTGAGGGCGPEGAARTPLSPRSQRNLGDLMALVNTRRHAGAWDLLTSLSHIRDAVPGTALTDLVLSDISEVARLRDNLVVALQAPGSKNSREMLNHLARVHGITPRIDAAGLLGFEPRHPESAALIAANLVPALMEAFTNGWADRIRECEASQCHDLFIDLSKKGTQRYCSARCASRIRARRSRASNAHGPTRHHTPANLDCDT